MNCLNKNNIYVLHRSTVERFKKSLYGAFFAKKNEIKVENIIYESS